MTRLCVSIFVRDVDAVRHDVARAIEAGADLIELRVDLLRSVDQVAPIVEGFDIRFIFTCRSQAEGGLSSLDLASRQSLVEACQRRFGGWVDLEQQFYADRLTDVPTILSAHDFQGRPNSLTSRWVQMQDGPAAVPKFAWTARSIRDNAEAFELLLQGPKPSIAICMGASGQISRILAKKFGAFLSFASLDVDSSTAPGQVTIRDLKTTYRWDSINPSTKVFGVVGSPVAHSMSPAIHNAGFDAIGFPGVYVPLLVEPGYESFKAFMETFWPMQSMHLSGLSITIPHKENALRYAQEKQFQIDPLAARIGAVNTFALDRPVPFATSTDYAAILDTVTDGMSIGRDGLRSLRVAVVGAGGTGRTAVAALAHFGAAVSVFNRTRARADELAIEFDQKSGSVVAVDFDQIGRSSFDVYINTTSMGMSPAVDASIFDSTMPDLSPGTLVFDTVYNPIETRLVRQARAAGSRTAAGIDMFIRQAVGQFQLWTGTPAPKELMRQIVVDRLTVR
jgi:3-dehydroquinate dehydratase / shikimate dehydrogenase